MDALLSALKSVAEENGGYRLDIGYRNYCGGRNATATIWWDADTDTQCECASGEGATLDDAIADMIAAKAEKMALALAEAA